MTRITTDPEINYKPRYYKPDANRLITADHVARYYGCLIAKMLAGNPSTKQMFSTRHIFDAVEPVKKSMTLDALKDMIRCLHFSDDWEDGRDEEWDVKYTDTKMEPTESTATHQKKFSILEDAYNRKWQSLVTFGKWVTADESRVAGWYHSPMTVGPEPKPIRTGATMHSLCVTKGRLRTYKLFVRVYGGRADTDLNV